MWETIKQFFTMGAPSPGIKKKAKKQQPKRKHGSPKTQAKKRKVIDFASPQVKTSKTSPKKKVERRTPQAPRRGKQRDTILTRTLELMHSDPAEYEKYLQSSPAKAKEYDLMDD